MTSNTRRAVIEITELVDSFYNPPNDEEREWFENSVKEILDEFFPKPRTTIDFTPAFNVSMNSTSSTSTNSVPKENDLDRRKEETRYNSRNPKGRTEYTPRRDGNVRDKK